MLTTKLQRGRVRRPIGVGLIRTTAWFVLLGATAVLVHAEAERSVPRKGVSEHSDLVYRTEGGREVRLDLYLPDRPAPHGGRPAVIAIHGGGWRGGSKSDMKGMATQLAEHGYVVAAIDYRLSRPRRPSWPTNFEDCREAVRWLRRHATDYQVDPNRLVALGVSAGGHLAALLGTNPDSTLDSSSSTETSARVQAVVDFYGPIDLEGKLTSRPLPATPVGLMLGPGRAAFQNRARAASPLTHLSAEAPPMLLIHGRDDELVPLEQSQTLAAALERVGIRHQLIEVDNATHGFGFHVAQRPLLPDILAFLDSVWNVKPEGLEKMSGN